MAQFKGDLGYMYFFIHFTILTANSKESNVLHDFFLPFHYSYCQFCSFVTIQPTVDNRVGVTWPQ